MIIVNQDKNAIINFDNIANLVVIENNIVSICNVEESTGITIAEYKTEERAKEVLNEIVCLYKKVKVNIETKDLNNTGIKSELLSIEPDIPKVYEMPIK